MAVLNTGLATPSRGFTIDYSCRFNDDDSPKLTRTPGSASNRRTFTFSAWIKLGATVSANQRGIFGSYSNGSNTCNIQIQSGGEVLLEHYVSGYQIFLQSTMKLRDPSSWYHIVVAVDTTQATEANRVKMYINGSQITDFLTSSPYTYPAQNLETRVNNTNSHEVGIVNGAYYWDGLMAEVHFIDGTALDHTSFGEEGDYGEWKPIEVTGLTYGTNGFYLDFSDSAALGDDAAGSNDWTVNNLAAADQMLDTPTNNFCTLMPMANISLSEGNTKVTTTRTGYWDGSHGSLGVSSGKWYYEVVSDVTDSDNFRAQPGWIAEPSAQTKTWNGLGGTGDPSGSHNNNYQNQPHTTSWYKDGSTDGTVATLADDLSIVQWAIDLDNNKVYYGVNNTWEANDGGTDGNPSGGTNESLVCNSGVGDYTPVFMIRSDGTIGSNTMWFNFGQDSSFAGTKTAQGNADGNGYGDFYYTPPTDFLALCTANLDTPAVIPSEHFSTKIWTGTTADQAITGVGFQPDFVWIKKRNGAYNHYLNDAVRGQGKTVFTDGIWAEYDYGATMLESFDSDGFTLDGDGNYVNKNAETYVGWNWKANGSGSANTDGDMAETVTVSANTDAGFSIVTYTGDGSAATVGHGLSKAPELIIIKNRSVEADDWAVYHSSNTAAPETDYLLLSTTAPTADDAAMWNDTAPSATVFTVGTNHSVNADDETYIAYCFHSVEGYSKVGSYKGNNDADGTFIYLGFRPKYFMIKASSTTDGWVIYDSLRDSDGTSGYNKGTAKMRLFADNDPAETEIGTLDFLSNGVKIRASGLAMNEAHTYIYLAFAETPFKYANAR